jgi:hypothetical protein
LVARGTSGRIDSRLRELDRDGMSNGRLEANTSAVAFTGTVLDTTLHKRMLGLPVLVNAFVF